MRTHRRQAFTLVEILIVVIILGILAAIVVPQFTNASQDAQASNVASQLQTIRSQIELYRVRNNGAYPPSLDSGTWDDLISEDYMRSAPVNPRTGVSDVAAAEAEDAGWVWSDSDGDGTNDTISACYFDEDAYLAGDMENVWTGP